MSEVITSSFIGSFSALQSSSLPFHISQALRKTARSATFFVFFDAMLNIYSAVSLVSPYVRTGIYIFVSAFPAALALATFTPEVIGGMTFLVSC